MVILSLLEISISTGNFQNSMYHVALYNLLLSPYGVLKIHSLYAIYTFTFAWTFSPVASFYFSI